MDYGDLGELAYKLMEHCQYKKLAEIILKRNRDNCYTFTEIGTLEAILHNANDR